MQLFAKCKKSNLFCIRKLIINTLNFNLITFCEVGGNWHFKGKKVTYIISHGIYLKYHNYLPQYLLIFLNIFIF